MLDGFIELCNVQHCPVSGLCIVTETLPSKAQVSPYLSNLNPSSLSHIPLLLPMLFGKMVSSCCFHFSIIHPPFNIIFWLLPLSQHFLGKGHSAPLHANSRDGLQECYLTTQFPVLSSSEFSSPPF